MKEIKKTSIVTATFNGKNYTKYFYDSLQHENSTFASEIIYVDDCSTDGTREFLDELVERNERVKVYQNEENRGFAYGNNFGAKQAKGKYVAFLNSDLVMSEGWLEPMLEIFKREERVGAVGNVQYSAHEPKKIDHSGIYVDRKGRVKHVRKIPKCGKDYEEFDMVTAACMVMRREVFLEMGGFDEIYRNGYEDFDLCLRLRQAGYRNFVSYRSVVGHYVSSSPGRKNHEDRNREIFEQRWGGWLRMVGRKRWPVHFLQGKTAEKKTIMRYLKAFGCSVMNYFTEYPSEKPEMKTNVK